jgi:hypothetical protein
MLPTSSTSKNPCTQKSQQETEAECIAKNHAASEVFVKKEYAGEKFISAVSELINKNKRTKNLSIPENVRVAESRLNIRNSRQLEILRKELRQADVLARQGNSVWLTPEPGEYGKKVMDAVVNGVPYEFRYITGRNRQVEQEFSDANTKNSNANDYLYIESNISKQETKRRISMVLNRHPDYTGKIVVSFQGNSAYYWNTEDLR